MSLPEYYRQLEGGTITKVWINDGGYPTFIIRLKTGILAKAEISMDEEGNGPGFIFLEDYKQSIEEKYGSTPTHTDFEKWEEDAIKEGAKIFEEDETTIWAIGDLDKMGRWGQIGEWEKEDKVGWIN